MRTIDLIVWALVLIATTVMLSLSLSLLPFATLVWGLWIMRRIGGISGDGHGAGIELTETALLLAAAIASALT